VSDGEADVARLAEGPRCECGVFGVFAPGEDVATLTYFGLFALQHRGQESAGISVSDGRRTVVHREMGLVSQVFAPADLAARRRGTTPSRSTARPAAARGCRSATTATS
jgi:glutamine phosphoribosylpyrophosphate amidotransferase